MWADTRHTFCVCESREKKRRAPDADGEGKTEKKKGGKILLCWLASSRERCVFPTFHFSWIAIKTTERGDDDDDYFRPIETEWWCGEQQWRSNLCTQAASICPEQGKTGKTSLLIPLKYRKQVNSTQFFVLNKFLWFLFSLYFENTRYPSLASHKIYRLCKEEKLCWTLWCLINLWGRDVRFVGGAEEIAPSFCHLTNDDIGEL